MAAVIKYNYDEDDYDIVLDASVVDTVRQEMEMQPDFVVWPALRQAVKEALEINDNTQYPMRILCTASVDDSKEKVSGVFQLHSKARIAGQLCDVFDALRRKHYRMMRMINASSGEKSWFGG